MSGKAARNQNYFAKVKLAKKLYGVTTTRPQDVNSALLKQCRRINYMVDSTINPQTEEKSSWSPILEDCRNINVSNVGFDDNLPLTIVDSDDKFEKMQTVLQTCSVIAVDLENTNIETYAGFIALIQIGTQSGDYIFHPYDFIKEVKTKLKEVLENGKLIKVMHGCQNDIFALKREYGIYPIGVIDCQFLYEEVFFQQQFKFEKMANSMFSDLHLPEDGVITLSDWRNNPLHPDQIQYSRSDVHVLLRAFKYISKRATIQQLQNASERTKILLRKNPPSLAYNSKEADKIFAKCEDGLNISLFKLLHKYRDVYARQLDVNPKDLFSDVQLKKIAERKCDTLESMSHVFPKPSTAISKAIPNIIDIVLNRRDALDRVENQLCHNCFSIKGHKAWACFQETNRRRDAIYMKMNHAFHKHQNRRRKVNKKLNKQAKKD